MKLSQISKEYLFAMVQAMYKYETTLTHMPDLLNDKEMFDFYSTYMGYPSCRLV